MPKRSGKNANGEGTIYARTRNGKTRYYAELTTGYDAQGKPVRHRSRGFAAKREADRWLTDLKKARNDGTLPAPTKQTLGGFMREWLDTTVVHEVGPSTLQQYRDMFAWYIEPNLGAVELAKLKPPQIQALYHSLIQSGLSARTVQIVHTVLNRAMNQAVEWEVIARNPVEGVKRPRVRVREMQALTPEQILRFIEAAKSDRLHALFILAVTTGLRRGELLGLRWEDVDLKAGTLTVRQQLKKVGEALMFGETKTEAARREVHLPEIAVEALTRWKREQARERLAVGEAWAHPELVFTTAIGTPVHPRNLTGRNYLRVLEAAGLPRIRFHDLRHTAFTFMLENDVKVEVVQKVAGHSDIATTLRTYRHVRREEKKEAAQVVDDFLKAAQSKK